MFGFALSSGCVQRKLLMQCVDTMQRVAGVPPRLQARVFDAIAQSFARVRANFSCPPCSLRCDG